MTYDDFITSVNNKTLHDGMTVYQQALYHDALDAWDTAHTLIQDLHTSEAAHIHAYLHRKEGDQWNADYWYRRANVARYKGSLDEEWQYLAKRLST